MTASPNGVGYMSGLPYQGSPSFGLGLAYGGAWLAGGGLIDAGWWSGVDSVVTPGLVMGSEAGYGRGTDGVRAGGGDEHR